MKIFHKRKYLARIVFLGLLLCMVMGSGVHAAKWVKNTRGIRYYISKSKGYAKGWRKIGKNWYYFDQNGYRKTGWLTLDGKRYALKPSNGARISGKWFRSGKNYYYADKNGIVQKNTWVDGCYLKSNYKRASGWLTLDGKKYYLQPATGKKTVGKLKLGGNWYYFDKDGCMVSGKWQKIKKKYYYFHEDGTMAKNEWIGAYYVKANGVKSSKTRSPGLFKDNGKTYFLDENYNKTAGWVTVGKARYYFGGSDNAAYTGLQTVDGKQYYFNTDGVMKNGWQEISGASYYFNADGAMVTGQTMEIAGESYTFNAKGVCTDMTKGRQIVNYAKKFLGNPYVYGGNDLNTGVDCSGFAQQVMKHFKISIPRTADEQRQGTALWGTFTKSRVIKPANLMPGDLLFYGTASYADHVAIYIGNKQIIHACDESTGIIISPYNYRKPVAARRYW